MRSLIYEAIIDHSHLYTPLGNSRGFIEMAAIYRHTRNFFDKVRGYIFCKIDFDHHDMEFSSTLMKPLQPETQDILYCGWSWLSEANHSQSWTLFLPSRYKPKYLLLIRKFVHKMKGSKRRIVNCQVSKKAANLGSYLANNPKGIERTFQTQKRNKVKI